MDERSWLRLTWVLLAANLAWRAVRWAQGFPIWGDEAFVAVNFWDRGYLELVRPLEYGQIAPLGWLWLEKAMFDLFGPWERALRLPAFVAGIAATLLVFRLCRRALPPRAAALAFAVYAASYYPMRHGAELKPYASDLLVAVAMLSLAWDWLVDGLRCARWKKSALVALSLLAPWLSLPSLFVVGGCGLVLGLHAWRRGGPRAAALYAGWMGAAAASALAMVVFFAAPHAESASWLREMAMWETAFPPLERPWLLPWWLIERHAGYMSAYPTGGRDGGSAVSFALFALGVFLWWRSGRRAALALLLAPLLFNLVAAALGRYPYGGSVRVSIYLAPAFCLLAGTGLHALCGRAHGAARGIVGLLLLFALAGLGRDLVQPHKQESDRRALELAEWLAGRVQPGDQVLGYLWPGDNPPPGTLAAVPRDDAGPAFFAQGGSLARLRFQLRRALPMEVQWGMPAPRPGARTWLLAYRDDNQTDTPFPASDWQTWRDAWEAARGPARDARTFGFGKDESVEALLLPAAY